MKKYIKPIFIVIILSIFTLNCGNNMKILFDGDGNKNRIPGYAIYKFNDLTDSSGNGHHLINQGAVPADNRDSIPNSAFNFSAQCLQASTLEEFNFTAELTIAAWIRSVDTEANQKVAGKMSLTPNAGYLLAITNDHVYVEFRDSTGAYISYFDGSKTLTDNTWHHIAMTWKTGGSITTYVDGVLDNQIPASANPIGQAADTYFTIGAKPWDITTPAYRFQGEIDDVRVYEQELSGPEIQALALLPAD